ncbi:M24 family metallopeptidase [Skermania sp. ID1734]|uniref:aminopeptidase P family protein n=1 Tax=Skermania sp. ID1734 TaxID=2597516 RepID=UPI00117FFD6E|nr:aminopeptidase P family protein [Skermania sp. ID1734]TSD94631.1 M24 family metallopeptidase [Skermania sp. ID1734]
MTADYRARRQALRDTARAAEADVDAVLITNLTNIRYLTGFTGSNAALWVDLADTAEREASTVIATDGRYRTQVGEQVPDLRAHLARAAARGLVEATEPGTRRLGYESHVVTVDEHRSLQAAAEHIELVRLPGLVEKLREVKDEDEIRALHAACAAADAALAQLIDDGGLRPGRTEREVGRELEFLMFAHGAEAVSFETIVAAGPNSAVPHHRPTRAVLRAGDFVKLDFGAVVDGYHSDMTRTYVLGTPAHWQREIYELVQRAQEAGRAALAPDMPAAAVDAAARSLIDDAGYGELFAHGLGHGVGLEIHEAPGIGAGASGSIPGSAVVTVEPGVYLAGRGGVRIEDTLVVRAGGPELLTMTPRELTAI